MLEINQYRKKYHGQLVLSIEHVVFDEGIHWIKGENGSGKSTLFKSISGIIPFDGIIQWDEISLTKKPIKFRSLVHYAEAEPVFPGFLTAKDLVRFIGKTRNASVKEQDELVEYFHLDS